MTGFHTVELVCDGCQDRFREPSGSIEAARRHAKQEGWTSRRGLDLCLDCSRADVLGWLEARSAPEVEP